MERSMFAVMIVPNLLYIVAAGAAEPPRIKPGLWEIRVQATGYSSPPVIGCIGAMSDQQRQLEQANIRKLCSKHESRELDGKWVVDAVCAAGGNTVTQRVTTSLAGDSFHEENKGSRGNNTSDGKWLGACKPGQKPDMFK